MSALSHAPTSVGVTGTTLVHGLFLGAFLLAAHRSSGPVTVSYAVTLNAAPAPSDAAAKRGEVVPPKREVETVATKGRAKKPEPKKAKPAPVKAVTKTTPLPGEKPGTGEDVLTRTFPGLDFPFPDYLRSIVNQIYSRFAQEGWGTSLEATIGFTIHRDGSVTDIVTLKQSTSYSFNVAARGAVEAAAKANAFGPLPNGWPSDKLDISFSFSPRKP